MYGLNRYLCEVLDEMRKADETKNYSYLGGLIEEAQSMGNRMEASLQDVKDIKALKEKRRKLKKEVEKLEKKKEKMERKMGFTDNGE